MTAEPQRTEREQLIQDYLDGHVSRGGLLSDEIRGQAVAYAERVASNREYEAQLRANADKQRAQLQIASNDAALRERSNRKALANAWINRFAGENAQITPAMREQSELYAARVLAQHDPSFDQRQREQAAQRLDAGRRKREQRMLALRAELAEKIGSDDWRALRDETKLLRQALDDLDATLMREAMRPAAQQDTPQEPGEGSAVSAPGSRRRPTTARNR